MFRSQKITHCPKGIETVIIKSPKTIFGLPTSTGFPKSLLFEVESVQGEKLSGTFKMMQAGIVNSKKTRIEKLKREHSFQLGGLDSEYQISVIPDCDVTVTFINPPGFWGFFI